MKKIILFNSPPSGGKDFACRHLEKNLKYCRLDKFARILKERTHALYGFPDRDFLYYEDCKDIPNDDFRGLTPRQTYINVSENYYKVFHGDKIFGELLAKDLDNYDFEVLVISDCGFKEEAEVLIDKYGINNIMLIKVYKEGCDFENDSRDYITLPVKTIQIFNDGTINYLLRVDSVVDNFL